MIKESEGQYIAFTIEYAHGGQYKYPQPPEVVKDPVIIDVEKTLCRVKQNNDLARVKQYEKDRTCIVVLQWCILNNYF